MIAVLSKHELLLSKSSSLTSCLSPISGSLSRSQSATNVLASSKSVRSPPLTTSRYSMSTKTPPSDLPIRSFSSAKEFEAFLELEHATAPGIYVKFAKKGSGIASISGAEAVEVALCFGWIDGRANGLDESWWLGRYTPRRSKSIWSQKNVKTIGRLVEEGRIRPAGLSAVEAAKADGRWDRAYAGPATATVPADLAAALAQKPSAADFFQSLNSKCRYAVLWRVETASVKSRAKRIDALVKMLSEDQIPGEQATIATNSTTSKGSLKKVTKTKVAVVKPRSAKTPRKVVNPVRIDEPIAPRRPGLRQRP